MSIEERPVSRRPMLELARNHKAVGASECDSCAAMRSPKKPKAPSYSATYRLEAQDQFEKAARRSATAELRMATSASSATSDTIGCPRGPKRRSVR